MDTKPFRDRLCDQSLSYLVDARCAVDQIAKDGPRKDEMLADIDAEIGERSKE